MVTRSPATRTRCTFRQVMSASQDGWNAFMWGFPNVPDLPRPWPRNMFKHEGLPSQTLPHTHTHSHTHNVKSLKRKNTKHNTQTTKHNNDMVTQNAKRNTKNTKHKTKNNGVGSRKRKTQNAKRKTQNNDNMRYAMF